MNGTIVWFTWSLLVSSIHNVSGWELCSGWYHTFTPTTSGPAPATASVMAINNSHYFCYNSKLVYLWCQSAATRCPSLYPCTICLSMPIPRVESVMWGREDSGRSMLLAVGEIPSFCHSSSPSVPMMSLSILHPKHFLSTVVANGFVVWYGSHLESIYQ